MDDLTTGGQGGTAGSSIGGSSSGTGGSVTTAGSGGSGVGAAGTAGRGGSGNAAGSGGSGGSGGTGGSASGTGGTAGDDAGSVVPDGGTDAGSAEPFTLIDLAGESTSSEGKILADWDLREVFTFDVTGSHTSSATVEVANSQAQLAFAQPAPDQPDAAGVFRLVKIPAATGDGDNWGGWAHVMFNLGSALPQDLVEALPQWDSTGSAIIPGSKVIQLEAYYDDTVDPNFDWDDLLTIESGGGAPDVFDSVTAQGYNVHLMLVNHAAHADVAGGHDSAGIYIGYSAYITAPNQWVTLTFSAADEGRAENFYSAGSVLAASSSQITGVDVKPAGGYEDQDSNPLYLRNLRIVDVP